MKRGRSDEWSERQVKAGREMSRSWQEFFAAQEKEGAGRPSPGLAEQSAITQARERHEAKLMAYPNVVGVASGIEARKGKPTGVPCLVVYVSRKVARSKLKKAETIPDSLDGIPVDVVEIGQPEPLSP